MMTKINISDISEVSDYFIDSNGDRKIKLNYTKASRLINFIADIYINGETANIEIDNISKQDFDRIKMMLHSAAITKMNKHNLLIQK